MKIKHWQGYGLLNAKLLDKTTRNGITTLSIEVSGNHEYGLDRSDDKYDVLHWLAVKFDKRLTDKFELTGPDAYNFYNTVKINYIEIYGRTDERGCDLDTAIYEISYKL